MDARSMAFTVSDGSGLIVADAMKKKPTAFWTVVIDCRVRQLLRDCVIRLVFGCFMAFGRRCTRADQIFSTHLANGLHITWVVGGPHAAITFVFALFSWRVHFNSRGRLFVLIRACLLILFLGDILLTAWQSCWWFQGLCRLRGAFWRHTSASFWVTCACTGVYPILLVTLFRSHWKHGSSTTKGIAAAIILQKRRTTSEWSGITKAEEEEQDKLRGFDAPDACKNPLYRIQRLEEVEKQTARRQSRRIELDIPSRSSTSSFGSPQSSRITPRSQEKRRISFESDRKKESFIP